MSADWRTALAGLDDAISVLSAATVGEEHALSAVLALTKCENELWKLRRSIEAAWLDLAGDVSRMVELIAATDEMPASEVVEYLHRKRVLTVDWYRAKKELHDRGIPVPIERTDQ